MSRHCRPSEIDHAQPSNRIDYNLALAPLDLIAGIVAARTRTLKDWGFMMPAVNSPSRPMIDTK